MQRSRSISKPRKFAARMAASIRFDIDPFRKHCLLNGLDDIGLTLKKSAHIEAFEQKSAVERPWL